MVSVESRQLRGGGTSMKNKIWDLARPTIEAWTGMKLQPSSLYGIRMYTEGAILAPHVDRLPLVSSCIINVDQDVDEPWILEVFDRNDRAVNVTMEPGDMVLCKNGLGLPFTFFVSFVLNIYVVSFLQTNLVVWSMDDRFHSRADSTPTFLFTLNQLENIYTMGNGNKLTTSSHPISSPTPRNSNTGSVKIQRDGRNSHRLQHRYRSNLAMLLQLLAMLRYSKKLLLKTKGLCMLGMQTVGSRFMKLFAEVTLMPFDFLWNTVLI